MSGGGGQRVGCAGALAESALTRARPRAGLRFHDLQASRDTAGQLQLKPRGGVEGRNWLGRPMFVRSEPGWAQAEVKVGRAYGVPLPPDTVRESVVSRRLNAALLYFDEENRTTRFVGNVYTMHALWRAEEEDVWHFEPGLTRRADRRFVMRTDWPAAASAEAKQTYWKALHLLLELVITVNRDVRGEVQAVDMCCGWANVSVAALMDMHKKTSLALQLRGGVAGVEAPIDAKDVKQRRKVRVGSCARVRRASGTHTQTRTHVRTHPAFPSRRAGERSRSCSRAR